MVPEAEPLIVEIKRLPNSKPLAVELDSVVEAKMPAIAPAPLPVVTPCMVNNAIGPEVPMPTLPAAVTVNWVAPEEEATIKEAKEVEPWIKKVEVWVVVPTDN